MMCSSIVVWQATLIDSSSETRRCFFGAFRSSTLITAMGTFSALRSERLYSLRLARVLLALKSVLPRRLYVTTQSIVFLFESRWAGRRTARVSLESNFTWRTSFPRRVQLRRGEGKMS